MSKQNKIEQKAIRRRARIQAQPSPCLAGPENYFDKVARRISRMPIDRVARLQKRSQRQARKAQRILDDLAPGSMFRPAIDNQRKGAIARGFAAMQVLQNRLSKPVRVIDPAVIRREALKSLFSQ